MTDEALTTEAGEAIETDVVDPALEAVHWAMARFDAQVDPVLAQFSHSLLVNGHQAATLIRAVRAGVLAALTYQGPDTAEAPQSRDETHASINEVGALTPEAVAAVAEAKASGTPLPGTVDEAPPAAAEEPADPEPSPAPEEPAP